MRVPTTGCWRLPAFLHSNMVLALGIHTKCYKLISTLYGRVKVIFELKKRHDDSDNNKCVIINIMRCVVSYLWYDVEWWIIVHLWCVVLYFCGGGGGKFVKIREQLIWHLMNDDAQHNEKKRMGYNHMVCTFHFQMSSFSSSVNMKIWQV